MKESKFIVRKFISESNNESEIQRHLIIQNFIPLLELNQYLEQKSLRSYKTGKQEDKGTLKLSDYKSMVSYAWEAAGWQDNNLHMKQLKDKHSSWKSFKITH